MSHIDISHKDRQAIEKKEFQEYEQRRLRGTGYDMMKFRDVGIGWLHNNKVEGKDVEIKWHVDEEKRVPHTVSETSDGKRIEVFTARIPEDKFLLRIGEEEALVDKVAFQKLFRWV